MGMMIVVAEQIEKMVVVVGFLLQGNHRLAKYSNRI